MADPTTYTPGYSFTGYQEVNPTLPLPAPELDDELANVSLAVGTAVNAIKDIRRDDGALKNEIVTTDALAPDVLAGLTAGMDIAGSVAAAAVSASSASSSASTAVSAKTAAESARDIAVAAAGSVTPTTASNVGSGAGIVKTKTAEDIKMRTLVAPAAGLTITAGTDEVTFAFGNDLAALEALSSTGFPARTTTDTWALRSLSAPAAGFTITNPAGVAGNPTFVLANDLAALEALASTGFARRTGTDTWSVSAIVAADLPIATTSEIRSNTADKVIDTDGAWAAVDYVGLTDATTIAIDLSAGINFSVTLGGNRTLGGPSNVKPGQTGVILIYQDGTGGRTLAFNAVWKWNAGSVPSIDTTASRLNVLTYLVIDSTHIVGSMLTGVR